MDTFNDIYPEHNEKQMNKRKRAVRRKHKKAVERVKAKRKTVKAANASQSSER
jgi:hypothetical protein